MSYTIDSKFGANTKINLLKQIDEDSEKKSEKATGTSSASSKNDEIEYVSIADINKAFKDMLSAETVSDSSDQDIASTLDIELDDESKAELEEIQQKMLQNIEQMDMIEAKVQELAQKAEEEIEKAVKEQEAAVEEYDADAKKAVSEQIQAYIAANKSQAEGDGDGMSQEQLNSNISKALPNKPNLVSVITRTLRAKSYVAEIKDDLSSLKDYIDANAELENEMLNVISLAQEKAAQEAAQAAQSAEDGGCCDPIGFTINDEAGNAVKYDFINYDGNFDSNSDFLGSDNGWASMEALDTANKDGKIDASELKNNNIGLVKTYTDANGKKVQEIIKPEDISKEFGENFTVDLSSYKENTNNSLSHSAVDTASDIDGNGTVDQTLLGTFNVNIGGTEVSGYNTLDDVEYLESEYGTKADNSLTDVETSEISVDENFYNTYSEIADELDESASNVLTKVGLSSAEINSINQAAISEGKAKAAAFRVTLNDVQKLDKESEDLDESEESNEVDEAEDETEEASNFAAQDDLTSEQQTLLNDYGIPYDVIKQGNDAIKEYAEENNIELPETF